MPANNFPNFFPFLEAKGLRNITESHISRNRTMVHDTVLKVCVTGSALSHARSPVRIPCGRSEKSRAISKASCDEGTEKETGARRTPASKRPASSTRRITKASLDQLKSRLGDNTEQTRLARATCTGSREERWVCRWNSARPDTVARCYRRWHDGPWIPPQIGCGYLEGN